MCAPPDQTSWEMFVKETAGAVSASREMMEDTRWSGLCPMVSDVDLSLKVPAVMFLISSEFIISR